MTEKVTALRFSIVIPVYQVQTYLAQCVDSILAQSYPDYEVILVDDGSRDDCPALCDAYAASNNRIRVIHQANRGLANARNVGIRAARGEYLLLTDSDDYWPEADMLDYLDGLIQQKDADLLLFRVRAWRQADGKSRVKNLPYSFDVLDRFDHKASLHYLLSEKQFPVGVYAMCVKRKLLQERQISFIDGVKSEDYDWILSVLRDSARIYATDRILYVYRMERPGSITQSVDLQHLRDLLASASKWADAPGFSDPVLRRDVRNYAAYIYSTALVVSGNFRNAQQKEAVKMLKRHRAALCGARWIFLRMIQLSVYLAGIRITTVILNRLYDWKLHREMKELS